MKNPKATLPLRKKNPPNTVTTANSPEEMAIAIWITARAQFRFFRELYKSNAEYIVNFLTEQEELAYRIERCNSLEEARELLKEEYK